MSLTEEQKVIVESIGKPLLVLAGPGTGKTEVLAHRILYLLKNNLAAKDDIIGVTFTTKAAKQMQNRLKELGLEIEDQPLVCTLHSLSTRILKDKGNEIGISENFIIADGYESSLLLNDAISDINPRATEKIKKEWANKIILLKAEKKEPNHISNGLFKKVYERYQELLRFHSALDFQDLIIQAFKLLEASEETKSNYQRKNRHLLVDEFQDINKAEYSLIKSLVFDPRGLFVVGDDNQSIYGWRGGDPQIILNFTKDLPQAVKKPMTECFRCSEKIIKGADEFIKRDPPLIPNKRNSDPIWILDSKSDVQEAKYVSDWIERVINNKGYSAKDIAILYRGGDIADKIAENLSKTNIPIIRPSPEETKHVREFIACLRIIVDRRDSLALRVCLASRLAKGIGIKAIKKLRGYAENNKCSFWDALIIAEHNDSFKTWHKPLKVFHRLFEDLSATASKSKINNLLCKVAESLGYENEPRLKEMIKKSESIPHDWSLYDFIQNIRGLKGEKSADPRESGEEEVDAILFITMHSVKGLQRKVIFVLGMEKGSFPQPNGDIDEQRRLCYVAMTRAEEKLFLCYAKKREGKTAKGYNFYDKSPFIFEIPESYRDYIRPND